MTHPTRRCALAMGLAFPAALLPAMVSPVLWRAWALLLAALVIVMAVDWALALRASRLDLQAHLPDTLFVGDRDLLRLDLRTGWKRAVPIELVCDFDDSLEPQPAQRVVARGSTSLQVALVPRRRGSARLEHVWARWTGPLGLIGRTVRRSFDRTVSVVPNTRAVERTALRFAGDRTAIAGLKIERYAGEGSEFDSLREYVPGLDPRLTDWKASARRRRLLLRDYRAERNHPVVIALDSGYLMSERLAGIPRLDHAINAGLLLAYIALKTGDRVGLFTFDDQVRSFVEPRGGMASFAVLRKRTAAIDYSHAETNFTLALTDLGRRLRRRSLVVALTDFVDTVTASLMVENLDRLARRHLVLFVSLRDTLPDEIYGRRPRTVDDMHSAVAAHDLLREREVVLSRLRRTGVSCIESAPQDLSVRLLNRYLEIRRRELI